MLAKSAATPAAKRTPAAQLARSASAPRADEPKLGGSSPPAASRFGARAETGASPAARSSPRPSSPPSAPSTRPPGAGQRQELDDLRRRLSNAEAEARDARSRVEAFQTQLAERDRRIIELEGRGDDEVKALREKVRRLEVERDDGLHRDARIRELEAALAARHENAQQLEAELSKRNRRIQELEAVLDEAKRKSLVDRDDLKKIKGIGPSFEKALNELGVTTYEQIAAWTDEDIHAIAPKLNAKATRIRKDDWVKGARMQHALKQQQG